MRTLKKIVTHPRVGLFSFSFHWFHLVIYWFHLIVLFGLNSGHTKKVVTTVKLQALVVRRLDDSIHRINHYPVDKC